MVGTRRLGNGTRGQRSHGSPPTLAPSPRKGAAGVFGLGMPWSTAACLFSLGSCKYVFMLRSVVRDTLQAVVGLTSTHRAHPYGEPQRPGTCRRQTPEISEQARKPCLTIARYAGRLQKEAKSEGLGHELQRGFPDWSTRRGAAESS